MSSVRQSFDCLPRLFGRMAALMVGALCVLCIARSSHALDPSEIALVVNANVPEGRVLAEYYAAQRNIPPGRIISLNLDVQNPDLPNEEIGFADYEPRVAEPIREFLEKNDLASRVHCLVTFWGLPLRIANRPQVPLENEELNRLQDELKKMRPRVNEQVTAMEALAQQVQPDFKPDSKASDLDALEHRADAAMQVAVAQLLRNGDARQRGFLFTRLLGVLEQMLGPDPTLIRMSVPPLAKLVAVPITSEQVDAARERLKKLQSQLAVVTSSADGRLAERRLSEQLGLYGQINVIKAQVARLDNRETASALDSELSLIWWRGNYPRARWMPNPLYWRFASSAAQTAQLPGPVVMVSRLDGATTQVVHDVIDTSIRVEHAGLSGQLALDARGKAASDPYGSYDETLRNLAAVSKGKTNLTVTLDNKETLFPPGSVPDVALYCGWYSLRNYVPSCKFVPGAVGFHVASFELISLRGANEHGWVRGLMNDGVVATLGPVAEPYLHSFPRADEFFPLLMCGELTFAEVYWRTNPLTSWMQACIGDPLYNPYKVNPAIKIADLPRPLELALKLPPATTQPAIRERTSTAP